MTDDAPRFAELISKIAHELRSPLTSVKGFSATLVKRWDRFTDEQKLQFVETIHSDAERMGRIVSEVLDLARLEANRLEIHPVDVEIAPIARQSAEHLEGLPGGERVVVLISDEGEIEVTAQGAGDKVEIVIEDKGIGIEADRIAGLFSGPAPHGQRSGPS